MGIFPELMVQKLDPYAELPTVGYPGEDLGFDIYSLHTVKLVPNVVYKIRTGIAVFMQNYGFFIKDRSSLSAAGLTTVGGVIDSGYRGEIMVSIRFTAPNPFATYTIETGDKIAQLVPVLPATMGLIVQTNLLPESSRGTAGYGSTGR